MHDAFEMLTDHFVTQVATEYVEEVYSRNVFLPIDDDKKAKDGVAADLLREMFPRLAWPFIERLHALRDASKSRNDAETYDGANDPDAKVLSLTQRDVEAIRPWGVDATRWSSQGY